MLSVKKKIDITSICQVGGGKSKGNKVKGSKLHVLYLDHGKWKKEPLIYDKNHHRLDLTDFTFVLMTVIGY